MKAFDKANLRERRLNFRPTFIGKRKSYEPAEADPCQRLSDLIVEHSHEWQEHPVSWIIKGCATASRGERLRANSACHVASLRFS